MMKRIILSSLLVFGLSVAAFTQKTIKGKVIDASNNNPLFGATISFSGKGGTTTDKEGTFSIDCETVKKIAISFVGYEPYSLNIKNCNDELKISLNQSGN